MSERQVLITSRAVGACLGVRLGTARSGVIEQQLVAATRGSGVDLLVPRSNTENVVRVPSVPVLTLHANRMESRHRAHAEHETTHDVHAPWRVHAHRDACEKDGIAGTGGAR